MKKCMKHGTPGCMDCDEEYPYTGVHNIFQRRDDECLIAADDPQWIEKLSDGV